MKVIGIGEKKTPVSFISACEKFIYIEILKKVEEAPKTPGKQPQKNIPTQNTISKADKELKKVISDSINDLADEDGWAFLGDLGNLILKKQPDFDPRNFGFKKLVPLIKSLDRFEIDERKTGKNNITLVYVKTK